MKENIDIRKVLNRKIIIELRYTPTAKFFDFRGQLLDKLKDQSDWSKNYGLTQNSIFLSDNNIEQQERIKILVEHKRLLLVSSKINTIDQFFKSFKTIRDITDSYLGNLNILRIGCRILGTYKHDSNEYQDILAKFKNDINSSTLLIPELDINDLSLVCEYKNGRYQIGPIMEDDPFVKKEFSYVDNKQSVGFALDTDNYLTNTKKQINELKDIEDVFVTSLSVEKKLVELMSNL